MNSNIARYKGNTSEEILACFAVAKAGLFTEDPDIISDCLWTVCYLADTSDDTMIEHFAQNDTVLKIIEGMGSTDLSHFVPALRCMGNILTVSDP